MQKTLFKEAVAYTRKGWAVFPCNKDKTPRTTNGFADATTDYLRVRQMFGGNDDVLIGVAIPDGYVVVDVDPRNGGDVAWKEFVAANDFPTLTQTAKTAGGGWHLWYKVSAEPDELRSVVTRGVDLKRAGKGYVIVPPSNTGVGVYEWIKDDVPIYQLTEAQVDLLRKPKREERIKVLNGLPNALPDGVSGTIYGKRAVEHMISRLDEAEEGTRNDTFNSIAFQAGQLVAGNQLTEQFAEQVLCERAFLIGLNRPEIEKTWQSGFESGMQEPAYPKSDADAIAWSEMFKRTAKPQNSDAYWLNWLSDDDYNEPSFYLDPLLPKNAYITAYGATGASKSMVWNAILAQGSHNGLKASIYSLENPTSIDKKRLRRLRPNPAFFRMTKERINLADPMQVEAMIQRETGQHVIMLDTYSHCFESRSSDGNEKAIAFANVVRYIIDQTGATILTIDHTGYMNPTEPRDASAKRQQVDVAILMEKQGQWEAGDTKAYFRMGNKKPERFSNPFDVAGFIEDTEDGGLQLVWRDADFASRWNV